MIFNHLVVIFQGMISRHITSSILESLADTPVVFLNGARQTGKSFLVKWLASEAHPARYITLDDIGVLAAAREDPSGFLAGLDGPVILDEVQRAPELFLGIKNLVDRDRQSGRFLLTGSADVLLLPRLAESLAGRMEILTLWPFSQGEIEGRKEGFIDAAFSEEFSGPTELREERGDLLSSIGTGGYPEMQTRTAQSRREAWFESYVTSILQRDVRDIAQIEGLMVLPRLLALLAARSTALVSYAELARSTGLPQSTLKRYVALLETTFLLQFLPAWSGNLSKRLVKSSKLVLNDTGLVAHLLGTEVAKSARPEMIGRLLENFVVMELRKQATWSRRRVRLYHFRTHAGREVDILLEDAEGRIIGLEIKAATTVRGDDFRGLRGLAEDLGDRFHRGVVLYTGVESIPFGQRLHALPMQALWRTSVAELDM